MTEQKPTEALAFAVTVNCHVATIRQVVPKIFGQASPESEAAETVETVETVETAKKASTPIRARLG